MHILHCILRQIPESKDGSIIDGELVARYHKSRSDHLDRLDMELIKQVISNSSGVKIVIDGLDQCKEADTLLKYLQVLRTTKKLRILMSSRASNMNPAAQIPEARTIHIGERSKPAIERYIRNEIFESERGLKGQKFKIEESQSQRLYDLLQNRASGM